MAAQKVAPGSWVTVRVPDSFPVQIAIGDERPRPAFIDHVRSRRGGVDTVAKRRCPALRPGRYRVRAYHQDGVVETQIHVV